MWSALLESYNRETLRFTDLLKSHRRRHTYTNEVLTCWRCTDALRMHSVTVVDVFCAGRPQTYFTRGQSGAMPMYEEWLGRRCGMSDT